MSSPYFWDGSYRANRGFRQDRFPDRIPFPTNIRKFLSVPPAILSGRYSGPADTSPCGPENIIHIIFEKRRRLVGGLQRPLMLLQPWLGIIDPDIFYIRLMGFYVHLRILLISGNRFLGNGPQHGQSKNKQPVGTVNMATGSVRLLLVYFTLFDNRFFRIRQRDEILDGREIGGTENAL